MTYLGVLVQFVVPPLVLFASLAWFDVRRGRPLMGAGFNPRGAWLVILAHVAMALIYTTPWDNYLVATGVWWYNPDLVTGLTLWYVPIEEYTFFVLQTLMTGTWILALSRYVFFAASTFVDRPRLRYISTSAMGVMFFVSLAILLGGWKPGTYLALTLGWAALPFGIQLAFGADILYARLRFVATAIFVPTFYLCVVDAIAIQSGTWIIDPDQTTGIMIGGVLPLEEVVFFMVTNILVVFGVTLMMSEVSLGRAYRWATTASGRFARKEMHLHGEPQ